MYIDIVETCLILPLQEYGHIFPTLRLALAMKKDGIRVVYVVEERFHSLLKSFGLEYVELPNPIEGDSVYVKKAEEVELSLAEYLSGLDHSRRLVDFYDPDMVLVDVFYSKYGFIPAKRGIPLFTIHTCMDVEVAYEKPLNVSCVRTGGGKFENLSEKLLWIGSIARLYAKEHWFNRSNRLLRSAIKNNFKSVGISLYEYSLSAYCINVNPIVLGASKLSYSRLEKNRYFGLCLAEDRKIENSNEFKYDRIKGPEKWIYCSFGTNIERYKGISRILSEVVRVFNNLPNYRLVIQLGGVAEDVLKGVDTSKHVISKYFQGEEVIRRVDGVIFHGGYGTLKECVSHSRSMFVIPFFNDQFGMAARVEELKLGDSFDSRDSNLNKLSVKLKEWLVGLRKPDLVITKNEDDEEFEEAYRFLLECAMAQGAFSKELSRSRVS